MRVGVLFPLRNAAGLLSDTLELVLRQTRPPDEIVLVVAPSSDGTEALARSLAARARSRIRVLDNPAGDRASALNAGIQALQADVVALVDGQARLDDDYLERSLAALEATGAGVVGGPMRPRGRSMIGHAVAAALASQFGIGNTRFRVEDGPRREVDGVNLGIYRRSTFERVGGFNTALLRTEDDDMFARMREAGLSIWFDPSIRSTYLCRNDLLGLWRQFYGYGHWKVALGMLRPGAIRPRHLVPAAFVVVLAVAAGVTLVTWWPAFPLTLLSYAAVAWIAALRVPDASPAAKLLVPLASLTMHLAYGIGTLTGLLMWPRLRGRVSRAARDARP